MYLLVSDDPYISNPEYCIFYIYSGVKFFILLPTCLIQEFVKYGMTEYLKKNLWSLCLMCWSYMLDLELEHWGFCILDVKQVACFQW